MLKRVGYYLDIPLTIAILVIVSLSFLILYSIANFLFPTYLVFIVVGVSLYIIFSIVEFEILEIFSKYFYIGAIILLILTLIIGQATRGSVRWIQIGSFTLQSAEAVRPFILLFLASSFAKSEKNIKSLIKNGFLFLMPFILILIQPSLGVSLILAIGTFGIYIASGYPRKYLLYLGFLAALLIPLALYFLAPYQMDRIRSFMNPYSDPLGTGYNSIQSMIALGSGGLIGRGLGEGAQTQLAFLPDRYTDFVFASIGEELGFLGSFAVGVSLFIIIFRLAGFVSKAQSNSARAYMTGVFSALLFQIFVNLGMNMGIVPITGLPLPLVSAGGTSFIATMAMLGIVSSGRYKKKH